MLIPPSELKLKDGRVVEMRSPVAAEAAIMLEHLILLSDESYRNMNRRAEDWRKVTVEQEAKILSDFASSPKKFMLSAFHDGAIVGNLGFMDNGSPFSAHSGSLGMGLLQDFHGIGLGSALLRKCMDVCRANGIRRIELTVRAYNSAGIALYEHLGFERIGRLKEVAFIDDEYVDEFMYQILI